MKVTLAFLISCSVAALPAAAQPLARPTGYIGVGSSHPVNPLAARVDTGWNLTAGIGVVTEYVGLMLDFTYNDFGINRRNLNRAQAEEGSQRYWAVTLNPIFHVNQRGPVDFYVTAGGGIYSQITELRSRFGDPFPGGFEHHDRIRRNTIYKPGVDGGVGFAYQIGFTGVRLFAEARFHHMFTDGSGTSFVPVTVGVRF
jgi:hypothetical protein